MEFKRFVVPSDEYLIDVLGVSSEEVEGEVAARLLRLTSVSGEDVLISYDVPGRSFRVQISSGGTKYLDLLRESATEFSIAVENGEFHVRVTLESMDLIGELEILVGDEIVVRDKLLMA
ncbi:hypothetical protein ACFV4N_11295 [Actinosynnema sp. NPDC059797]